MNQQVNRKYQPLFLDHPRYFVLMGGRAGGRSTAASQFSLSHLVAPEYFRCAIMRYVLGDIRNSVYQDILDRADEQDIRDKLEIRENTLSLSYGNNRINGIGFRRSSGDQKAKLKSLANYNCIIIEEADEVSEEDFMQLDDSIRTIKSDIIIILLLNAPHKNHWIIKRWFNLLPSGVDGYYRPELKEECKKDTVYIHTTFRDNIRNLNPKTIDNFQAYQITKRDHYYNMIEGLVSEGARGRIFPNWLPIPDAEYETLPYEPFYGLDFGFSNHPTALIEIKQHNQKLYLRELIYEPGLTNQRISERMGEVGVEKDASTIADNAEPKSIAEINEADPKDPWNVIPSIKGPDSINAGIDMLLGFEVFYTESSVNIALEAQEYKWALDRNKEPTNKPVDAFNHAMDAVRGAVYTREIENRGSISSDDILFA